MKSPSEGERIEENELKRTFVDANILIAAARGRGEVYAAAMAILDDPAREFVSSSLVELEVCPKAVFHGQVAEARFYEAFFESVSEWCSDYHVMIEKALVEASNCGLGALDALHVAAAVLLKADELVTGEKPSKPLHRTKSVKVVSLQSD